MVKGKASTLPNTENHLLYILFKLLHKFKFGLTFACSVSVWSGAWGLVQFSFQLSQEQFIERIVLSLVCVFDVFDKRKLGAGEGVVLFHCSVSVFTHASRWLSTVVLFCFLQIALAIWVLLRLPKNVKVPFLFPAQSVIGVLMENAVSLWAPLGKQGREHHWAFWSERRGLSIAVPLWCLSPFHHTSCKCSLPLWLKVCPDNLWLLQMITHFFRLLTVRMSEYLLIRLFSFCLFYLFVFIN